MKCTLDSGNTKVFAKAVQSLSKFGGDLFVEAKYEEVLLRTLNPTKSAVGTYRFHKSFFDCYEINKPEECYCKLDMKACVAVFRSTKQVERCDMLFIHDKAKFQIQLKCQHETLKTTCISVDDEENIISDMTPESTCNMIRGTYKIFSEISNNFNPAEEEITLEAYDRKVNIKNYVEGSRVNQKFMRSQLQLKADEFEDYKVKKETAITFCLKEFKAMLLFAESLNENLCLQFYEAGSPLFASIRHGNEICCLLIMSTLSPEEVSVYDIGQESEVQEATLSGTIKRKLKSSEVQKTKSSKHELSTKRIEDETTLSNTSSLFQFYSANSKRSRLPSSVDMPRNDQSIIATSDRRFVYLPPSVCVTSGEDQVELQQSAPSDTDTEDCVIESPNRNERTNLRTIFSRCFHSTYIPGEPSEGSDLLYVSASDIDD